MAACIHVVIVWHKQRKCAAQRASWHAPPRMLISAICARAPLCAPHSIFCGAYLAPRRAPTRAAHIIKQQLAASSGRISSKQRRRRGVAAEENGETYGSERQSGIAASA